MGGYLQFNLNVIEVGDELFASGVGGIYVSIYTLSLKLENRRNERENLIKFPSLFPTRKHDMHNT